MSFLGGEASKNANSQTTVRNQRKPLNELIAFQIDTIVNPDNRVPIYSYINKILLVSFANSHEHIYKAVHEAR